MAKNVKLPINWQVLATKCEFKPVQMAIQADCSVRTLRRKIRAAIGKTLRNLKMEWKSRQIEARAAEGKLGKEMVEPALFRQTSSLSRHLKDHQQGGLRALNQRKSAILPVRNLTAPP